MPTAAIIDKACRDGQFVYIGKRLQVQGAQTHYAGVPAKSGHVWLSMRKTGLWEETESGKVIITTEPFTKEKNQMANETEERHVTLDWLGQGAAMEMWQDEFQKVLDNIADVNTKATTERTVTLTVKIKPDDNRRYGSTVIECKSKVAPVRGHATAIYMGRKQGKMVATEHDDRQEELPGAKVSDIASGAKK